MNLRRGRQPAGKVIAFLVCIAPALQIASGYVL